MIASTSALLGPTNTGKTWVALERMLTHASGMIGFPLRLLARENYDRVAALKGAESVALITGEERIVPAAPRYFVCTVEAMPVERPVDFLAVDEVQLAADRERGHVFTDRILHARGRRETLLIGSDTMRPLLRRLLPDAEFLSRPRLSTLGFSGARKLDRLPRRSAVVAFSVGELYALADRLRQRTGGAALVFGGLSPRTRNAQVGLYEAGEVDYLVATDAIGMGLNLDINHVAFTAVSKFDGYEPRALTPAEVAQIAGRAGRHVKDGTFGPTNGLLEMAPALVDAVIHHSFAPVAKLYWRNDDLDVSSPLALLASLERRPPRPELIRAREADDHKAYATLVRDQDVAALLHGEPRIRLLWQVCRIPDFRNLMSEAHTRLLRAVFLHLAAPGGRLPEAWVDTQVSAVDRTDGDVETLLARIASIRTWTYVSHRAGWVSDPHHWQARTRAVEDRLSDALHERLTEQFVDRRAAVLAQHDSSDLVTAVNEDGEVLVQGLRAGVLRGFAFAADAAVRDGSRGLLAAANRALRAGVKDRVAELETSADRAFSLTPVGQIAWREDPVARLLPGEALLDPMIEPLPSDLLDAPLRDRVRRRLAAWMDGQLQEVFSPLFALREATPPGPASGLAFVLAGSLGSVSRRRAADQVRTLSAGDREALCRLGVTLGRASVFLPALLRPEALRIRLVLWSARHGQVPGPPPEGRPCLAVHPAASSTFYEACGYQVAGPVAVRVDRLHRIAIAAAHAARVGSFRPDAALASPLGDEARASLPDVLLSLGYSCGVDGRFFRAARDGKRRGHRQAKLRG